jgi:OmpA-OmpF porin, OOP family
MNGTASAHCGQVVQKVMLHAIISALVLWVSPSLIMAADLQGSRDNPLLKRFGGSEIVAYDVKQFDDYELQIDTYKRTDLDKDRREFASPPLNLEGSITRIWYEAAGSTSSTEIAANYRNELESSGFEILYDSRKDPNATNWISFLTRFGKQKIQTSRTNYVFVAADSNTIRVLSAKKERAEGDLYVYLTTVEWAKDDSVYKARKGAYAAVDIIEVQPMKQNMVVVKADEMSEAITATGRVALYGIFFDTDRADIKKESQAALAEIAKLLQQEPDLALHVVGHTDNEGGFEHNLDLSKRRAQSVKAALCDEFGIDANRLIPNGVAYLAPVASNSSAEGRAKNRRVKLVSR